MNNRKTGSGQEQLAADYLVRKGHRILERNFRCRLGEIDIISLDRTAKALVFTEVKYRRSDRQGDPLEAVDVRKQYRICRTAAYYMMQHCVNMDLSCRFDVIAVTGEEIRHIENAFPYLQ